MRRGFSVEGMSVGKGGQGDRFCGRYEEAGETAVRGHTKMGMGCKGN